MARKKKEPFVDVGRAESEIFAPTEEVQNEFDQASQVNSGGQGQLLDKLIQHHSTSPALSGGDIDAAWEDSDVGEESVGGGNPTPDQSVVDELGEAVGLNYEDGEFLHTTEKVEARDQHRWELDPASSEGFEERMKNEGEFEEE
ncbi:MAG: DUF6335 family protein [Acidobacteriota bacterium]